MRIGPGIGGAALLAVAVWWAFGSEAPDDAPAPPAPRAEAGSAAAAAPSQPRAPAPGGPIGRFEPSPAERGDPDAPRTARAFDLDAGPDPTRDPSRSAGGATPPRRAPAVPGESRIGDAELLRLAEEEELDQARRDAEDLADVEDALADKAEALEFLPPDQLEARIQREMRRSRVDYDRAKTMVLSDYALAVYLARQKAGPDATPAEIQGFVDPLLGLIPSLTPEQKLAKKRDAVGAL
ncbi:MAG: hypothetical protein ACQGVC_19145 [Myxococcota bacterium]